MYRIKLTTPLGKVANVTDQVIAQLNEKAFAIIVLSVEVKNGVTTHILEAPDPYNFFMLGLNVGLNCHLTMVKVVPVPTMSTNN